jgi:hypothetical protein
VLFSVRDRSGNPFCCPSDSEGNKKIATDSPTRFFSGKRQKKMPQEIPEAFVYYFMTFVL